MDFRESGNEGIDPYDAFYLQSLNPDFIAMYFMVGDQKIDINNMPLDFDELQIPLAVSASFEGQFQMGWEFANVPEGWQIQLVDRLDNNTYDLRSISELEFAMSLDDETDAESRFELAITSSVANSNEAGLEKPSAVLLQQNYPNPFNPTTQIGFYLPNTAEVSLEVYNLNGQKLTELASGRYLQGEHHVTFDASRLSSGIYVYRLKVNGTVIETKKMTLIK